ncbi:glycerate kinase [Corynebacterium caspium]|uniref:glycerate kinase n=1 Tax=Corynebacterium caspium TaxID=234828 RepID=UPI00037369D4|nr:glycerate kinase [Corynebacterium caspium]WKD59040.1 Glycerate 2-kinase [Corynebacterium caspium DSM 44850]
MTNSPSVLISIDRPPHISEDLQPSELVGAGFLEVLPQAAITTTPLANGGKGTAEIFGGAKITLPTTDIAGRLIEASYIWAADTATAYIDLAAASGVSAKTTASSLLLNDSYGTGVLIADAETRGAQTIVLSLGDGLTIDGGTGILVALGAQPLDPRGYAVPKGGGYLGVIESIDTAQLNIKAGAMNWILLADAPFSLSGETGVAKIMGDKLGAAPADIEILENSLSHWAKILEIDSTKPGLGAGGGIPLALTWLSRLLYGNEDHVQILPAAPVIAQSLGLAELLAATDLFITTKANSTVLELAAASPALTLLAAPLSEHPTAAEFKNLGRQLAQKYSAQQAI